MMKTINPKQAQEKKRNGEVLFLDVRTPAEIRESSIEDCLCVPHDRVTHASELENLSRDQPLVLVCGSGKRATMAGEALEEKGFQDLSVMEGGIQRWEEHDLPLNKGKGVISLERQVRIAAGSLVAVGAVLAWFNPLWLILPGFVGCGLVFAGVTDTCGMGMMLAKMPWNR
jgi:rhodanese-related sulfurtransferase